MWQCVSQDSFGSSNFGVRVFGSGGGMVGVYIIVVQVSPPKRDRLFQGLLLMTGRRRAGAA